MKKIYNIPVIEVKTIGTEGIIAHSDVSSTLEGTSSGGSTSGGNIEIADSRRLWDNWD